MLACGGMRDYAPVATRRLRTANYDDVARQRLGDAFAKAREAAGYRTTAAFGRAAGIRSTASLEWLERGRPGVGQSILFAVGRFMPGWTEDTPRAILEGGDVPSVPEGAEPAPDDEDNEVAKLEIGTGEWLGYFRIRLSPEDYAEVLALWRMARQAQKERDAAVIEVHRLQVEVEALKSAERERSGVSGERT